MRLQSRFTLPLILLLVGLFAVSALSYAAVPNAEASADEVMAHAKSQAAAEHKNILLTFGASWCGNCRLFDKFLADPAIRPIMDKAFVFADLDTGERANDKRHANIPGGEKLQASLGGKDAGYPYIVMLDASGNRITDSIEPSSRGHGGNIGYPVAPNEIDWFLEMLKKGVPSLSEQERGTIRGWLKTHGGGH